MQKFKNTALMISPRLNAIRILTIKIKIKFATLTKENVYYLQYSALNDLKYTQECMYLKCTVKLPTIVT